MAKTRIVEQPPEDATSGDAERMADLNEQEGGELFRAIEEARSTTGAEVILTRTMPADKAGFCDKIPVGEFDLALLKSKYGPGTYRIRFNGPTGFLPGGSTIKVAPAQERASVNAAGGDFSSYLEMIDRREAERRARTDDWIKLAMPIVGAIATALITRQPSQGTDVAALVAALKPAPGPSLTDLSQVMVNMKTMTAPMQSESNVDTILRVFEAAQGMMGDKEGAAGGPGASSWIDIVRDLIKAAPDAIKPMLQARMMQMQAGRPSHAVVQPVPAAAVQSQPVGTVTHATQPSAVTAESKSEDNQMNMLTLFMPTIKKNLALVIGWAAKDRDPAIYADVLVDELPDNIGNYIPYPQMMGYLNHEQWFEEVCKIEPGLAPYREWCDECRQSIIAIFQSSEDPEETTKVSETASPIESNTTTEG